MSPARTVQPGGSFSSPGYATNANGTQVVVFGSVEPDNSVYALNARTGAKVWTYRTNKTTANDDVGAAPAPGVNGFAGGVVYITGKDKVSYALDLTTGKLIWQHALAAGKAGDIAGSALAGDTVYVDSDTGVYALNATTGAQVWHVLPKAGIYGSPAITGPAGQQGVITANLAGHLYALNPAPGRRSGHSSPAGRLLVLPDDLAGHHLHHRQGRSTADLRTRRRQTVAPFSRTVPGYCPRWSPGAPGPAR